MSAADNSASEVMHSLYHDHHGWLCRWLGRRLGCPFDAADLAHSTYLRLIVSGRMPQPAQSRAFLTQVANGLVIDLHRRRALERAYLDALGTLLEHEVPSAERQTVVLDTLMEIDRMLDLLPARVRETFLLSQFDRLTYRAIAKQLGISLATVRNYMLRAALTCLSVLGTASIDETLR